MKLQIIVRSILYFRIYSKPILSFQSLRKYEYIAHILYRLTDNKICTACTFDERIPDKIHTMSCMYTISHNLMKRQTDVEEEEKIEGCTGETKQGDTEKKACRLYRSGVRLSDMVTPALYCREEEARRRIIRQRQPITSKSVWSQS